MEGHTHHLNGKEVKYVVDYIEIEDVDVSHDFMKKHITFVLQNTNKYNEFYKEFEKYFLRCVLLPQPYEALYMLLNGHKIEDIELKYLRNSLRRIFSNRQHYKGIIGEHLFAFYYHHMVDDLLWNHGPKGRSSAEPGIDFVTFTGDKDIKESIKVTVWETKTTENSISSRANQIYDFFSEDGSFEENIDSEIYAITELFVNEQEGALKQVVSELYLMFINRHNNFCIGASAISPDKNTTENTFKKFADCMKDELTKEQRIVQFLFVEILENIMDDLRNNIWNRLQI